MSTTVNNFSRLRLRGCVHRKFEAHWQTSAALIYGAKSVCHGAFLAFAMGGAVWCGASDYRVAPHLSDVKKGNFVLLLK